MGTIRKFEKWFYRRYQFAKFNMDFFSHNTVYTNETTVSTTFFNKQKMYSRDFFAIYILYLDINIYKAPLNLKSRLFYRGKSSSKITILSTLLENKYNVNKFMEELIFFLIFRNLDYRKMFFFSALHYCNLKRFNLFFNVRKLGYTLRDLKHLSLPNLTLCCSISWFWIYRWQDVQLIFSKHFIFVYFSFLFFFFDDFSRDFV